VSTLPQLFRKSAGKKYCPACAINVEVRNAKIIFGLAGVILVRDLLIDGPVYGWASWQAWSLPLDILIIVLSLVLHELSHALVAKLLGGRVFGIQIGIGRQILRYWFNDFYLGLSLLPVSGVCFAGFPTNKNLRLRYALYISGGLFFHVLTLAIAIPLLLRTGNRFPFLDWIIVLNGLMLFINVLPRTLTTAAGQSGSDGMLLWRLLTGKLSQHELRRGYYHLAAHFAYQQGRTKQVARYIREGLSLDPSDEVLENLRVYLLLKENKLEEAYTFWKNIVESDAIEAAHVLQQAIFYNNYAWSTLMYRPTPDSLQIAREYAEKAYQMAPWILTLKGTLAAVFVEQGDYQKGVEWALSVAKESEEMPSPTRDDNIGANLATAALGYFYLGERETAMHYLQQATALAPNELAIQKAAATIQGNKQAVENYKS
jgi:tetratricopeptide (TPR) repeat protein